MSRRKRSHQSCSPSRHRERSASRSPPKRRKTPDPPPSTGENTLASILSTLQQIQTDMAKTNDRVSSIESHLEQPLGNFPPSHPSEDQISVRAYSDSEIDYSEDGVLLATEPQSQAIKPQHQAIKPSHTATRPSDEANASRSPERSNQAECPTTILQHRCTTLTQPSLHGNLKRN